MREASEGSHKELLHYGIAEKCSWSGALQEVHKDKDLSWKPASLLLPRNEQHSCSNQVHSVPVSEPMVTHREGGLVNLHAAVSEAFQFNTFLCLFTSHQRRSKMLCQPGAKSYWHWFLCSSFMWEGCGDLLVETPWQTLKKWVQPWAQIAFSPSPFPCAWLKCKGVPGLCGVRWWLPLNFPCSLLASETALGFLTLCLGSVQPLTLVLFSRVFGKCCVVSSGQECL